jgi:hypothetical protein
MEPLVTLTQQDLAQFDKLIADIPFKQAYPIFNFLRIKVQEAQARKKELELLTLQAEKQSEQ